jgi:ubiquinone/menaquinone biosynthesis C-methylase UbiE
MTDYFDQRAKDWDADPARTERARTVAQAICQEIPLTDRMTALEYGCGTGLLSFALHKYVGQITLADSSVGMLAVLREKIAAANIANMTPLLLDLATDPPPARGFDLLYTLMTLHHIPVLEPVLEHFQTLLNPSGYLCIADLDKEDGSFHGPGFDGHNGFDRAKLAARLEQIGFGNISSDIIYQVMRNVNGQKVPFPLFLMTAQKR